MSFCPVSLLKEAKTESKKDSKKSKKSKLIGDDSKEEKGGIGEHATYQTPIALSTTEEEMFRAQPIAKEPSARVKRYTFDPEVKEYNVENNIIVRNNGLTNYLQEFHFHAPAEHTIDSIRGDVELHFVFRSRENPETIYVIGLIGKVDKKAKEQRSAKIFRRILAGEPFALPNLQEEQYFSYPGSLTAGTFDDAVSWNFIREIYPLSKEDFLTLVPLSKGSRPLQPRDGRDIVLTLAEKVEEKCCSK